MLSLVLAALFFAGIHLGIAGTALRGKLVAAVGLKPYMAGFSIASAAGILWLARAYDAAPYIATWGVPEWWKPAAILLMLPASLLVVIGLMTPNPTSLGQEGRLADPPKGILRVTRHPFLTGVVLWAAVHIAANGDGASLIFFGCFAVVAAAGTVSIDSKRRSHMGATAWEPFAERTSIVPFAAILAGRNGLRWREIGPWRWAAALLAYALMLGGHAHVIGVSPFPS